MLARSARRWLRVRRGAHSLPVGFLAPIETRRNAIRRLRRRLGCAEPIAHVDLVLGRGDR